MGFLRADEISLSFGDRDILLDVELTLDQGSRTALSGANGSGKSTLLKILAGEIRADSGRLTLSRDARIAYLPQSGILLGQGTVREEAERAYDFILPLIDELDRVGHELTQTLTEEAQNKLVHRHHEVQEKLESSGYWRRGESIQSVLQGLGFSPEELDKKASTFSGGWQMRIALARALLQGPDILLLDEPTNYLDLEAKTWLEGFLRTFPGGVLLVSHDRGFLDSVIKEVAEIFLGELTVYKGNFSQYEIRRREEVQALLKAFEQQQQNIAKTEEFINRFRAKASKASSVQSRVKMLAKMERIEVPENLVPMHFRFPSAPHSGRKVLEIKNLGKSYGENKVLSSLDLVLERGEKLVVTGRNGAGKSTLMRILAGEDSQFSGETIWGTDVKTAYFSQDHETTLDNSLTVLAEIEKEAPLSLSPRLRDLLGAFLFRGDDVQKKVGVLSGGEKNRLTLIKLLLKPANVLLLDEPTNHLDMASKDVLLEALQRFEGTVIFVSHDRYFISKLAGKVLELGGGQHRVFQGDWDYYQDRLSRESIENYETQSTPSAASLKTKTDSQSSREDLKKRQAQIRRFEKEEHEIMQKLESLDREIYNLEHDLSDPEVYSNGPRCKEVQDRLNENLAQRDEALKCWEDLAQALEDLKNSE